MPFGMSGYVQSVQVQGTVYIGGGYGDNIHTIMAFDLNTSNWSRLPPYRAHRFAMTVINKSLVLVGGRRHRGYCKMLGVWRAESKKWTHPYPDMPAPRSSCSAVVYKHWLVVAGGWGHGFVGLSSVEVMNTNTKVWYVGPPTPIAWSSMKTTIAGDVCYFMGGAIDSVYTNRVFSVSLPALVSQLNYDSSAKDTQTWKELPQLTVTRAAPLSVSGSLLAVGGEDKDYKAMRTLNLYQPDAGQWVKAADMPTQRYAGCTCIITDAGELLVAGGWANYEYLVNMDTAQIH